MILLIFAIGKILVTGYWDQHLWFLVPGQYPDPPFRECQGNISPEKNAALPITSPPDFNFLHFQYRVMTALYMSAWSK